VANALVFVCLFLSGALGLVYEIAWIRKASLVFGAASFALSTVLAVFFGGLALGSWLFGALSRSARRPLRVYGLLELGIGLLAIASPLAFRAADLFYGWLYPATYERFALLSAVRLVGVALVLLPPAILMGGTLPLFCAQYVRSGSRIARSVGLLYGLNTLGAAVGCAACGFLLIPRIGVDETIRMAGLANVGIGILVWLLPVAPPPMTTLASEAARDADAAARSSSTTPAWILPALFFATGYVALANEVLWTRYLSLLMHNTVYTYTVTLSVILAGIVVGSIAGARFFDRLRRRALVFGALQVTTGLIVMVVLLLPVSFWEGRSDPEALDAQVSVALLVLLAPALLSGLSFPLAIRMAVRDAAGAGRGVGRMTALNTAGGIAGSLATGFLVLPSLGLERTLLLVTGTSLAIGFVAWLALESTLSRGAGSALAAAAAALWLAIPILSGTKLPQDFLARGRPLVDFREGLNAQMAIVRTRGVETLEIDRLWQGESRKTHQVMAAHVPMLFAPRTQRVLVVGLGPGQTASRFLQHPIERLDCVEIERELIPLVHDHFDSAWMSDPRVRFLVEDGRNFLTHTDQRYDVISIEIGQVFRPGLAGFYSEDFYRRARARLEADGVLAQFLPIGYFTLPQLRTVVRSFLAVFPEAVLWYNKSEFLLIGSNAERLRLTESRLALLATNEALREDLAFSYWGGPAEWLNRREVFLGGFLLGPAGLAKLAADAPTYRDDRPWLEYETSHRGAAAEATIVEQLQALAEPVDAVLDAPLDAATRERVDGVRTSNLRDLLASKLVRFAQQVQERGETRDLLAPLRKAVEWNPRNIWAHLQLAGELRRRGQPHNASDEARRALAIDSSVSQAHHELAADLAATGSLDAAMEEYREALRLTPDAPDTHLSLANLLYARGDLALAAEHYRAGLDAAPAATHLRLGMILAAQGLRDESRRHLEEAARLAPSDAAAAQALAYSLNEEAWLLATAADASVEQVGSATALAERAAVLTRREDAAVLDTLAAAYAAGGRFTDAVTTARRAVERARQGGSEDLARAVESRITGYSAGRPFHEEAPAASTPGG
jgi:spermidine synthase